MKKYFSFYGRAKRKEYWTVTLGAIVLALLTSLFYSVILLPIVELSFLVSLIIKLLLIWLILAVTARRLRDARINLWFILLSFVPFVNLIAAIAWGYIKSKK